MFLASIPYAQVQQVDGGGSDASGGGSNPRTQIREIKMKAVSVLEYFLSSDGRTQRELTLLTRNMTSEGMLLFTTYGRLLSQELKKSELYFYSTENDRQKFFLDGEEKTFKTDHHESARIDVNLPHANETHIRHNSAVALLMREVARHLTERFPIILDKLDQIEDMGLALLNTYEMVRGAVQGDIVFEDGDTSEPSLHVQRAHYNEIRKNPDISYIYEDFFHYYLKRGSLSNLEQLIHETYWKAEEFLARFHFPIHFEFRGNQADDALLQDHKNVIYRERNNIGNEFVLHRDIFQDVIGSMDVEISDKIQDHPYEENRARYLVTNRACMCEVVARTILMSLNLHEAVPRIRISSPELSGEHKHHSYFEEFSEKELADIEEFLATRIVIVQKQTLTLLSETADFELYQTLNGIYFKFKDSFIRRYSERSYELRRFSITIKRINTRFGIDGLAKDEELATAFFRGDALRTADFLFYLQGSEPDPMFAFFSRGGDVVMESFIPGALNQEENVEIEIRLLKDSLGIYHDSLASYSGIRLPSIQKVYIDLNR